MSLPDAIDLSHHLSQNAKRRGISPLKGLQKYYGKPGLISLAGGLPSPEYFPFNVISSEILPNDHFPATSHDNKRTKLTWFRRLFRFRNPSPVVTIPRYPKAPEDISMARDLQYSLARGSPQLEEFTYNFSARVHKPAYKNFATMVHTGNTDGWFKAVMVLCESGQGVLTSEWAYASALAAIRPYGIEPVSVAMDHQGMRDDALRNVLSAWDETERGMPRPHVLYIVPIGQNPTGATMGLERKKAIYDVCVEFDVIIVEDDPYYFLQEGEYLPPQERRKEEDQDGDDVEHFLSQLSPSFLRVDYQGRVIRLDSFSKTIAPGSRLGWCTCNPLFAERIERQAEISTQAPCGFSQSIITSLLLNWKFEGYIRWLSGVRMQYIHRRDYFVDCLAERFDLVLSTSTEGIWSGCKIYIAFPKSKSPSSVKITKLSGETQPLFSLVPPSAGMFTWLQMHFEHHPLFPSHGSKALETKLWVALAEAGLLFAPGSMFASGAEVQLRSDHGHFRISFSNAEFIDLKKAVDIFASVLQTFYEA